MKGLKLLRTFKEGLRNYTRNGWLTVATVVVMTLSLFNVGMAAIRDINANLIMDNLRDKINISVSFNPDVTEASILSIKKDLEKYKEVASIEYISRDQALSNFVAMSDNDPIITDALEAIGENPLLASLNIKAHSPEQYDVIANALLQSTFKDDISYNNYKKNKVSIDSLSDSSEKTKKGDLIFGIISIAVSFLITFNTIRINMHSRRSEFEIMRLVGASNTYVRMPSVFEGILYGVTAIPVTLIALLVFLNTVMVPNPGLFITSDLLLNAYESHFIQISLLITVFSLVLGALGGFVAVRKYLKV